MVALPVGQVQCPPRSASGMSMGSTGPPEQEAGVGCLASPWWGGWAASGSQTLGARPILGHLLSAQAPGFSRKLPGGGQCPGWEAWLGWGTGPGVLCFSASLWLCAHSAWGPSSPQLLCGLPTGPGWVWGGGRTGSSVHKDPSLGAAPPPPARQEFPLLPPGRPGSIW